MIKTDILRLSAEHNYLNNLNSSLRIIIFTVKIFVTDQLHVWRCLINITFFSMYNFSVAKKKKK